MWDLTIGQLAYKDKKQTRANATNKHMAYELVELNV